MVRLEPHLEDSTNNFNPWSSVGYLSLQFPSLNQVFFKFLMKIRLRSLNSNVEAHYEAPCRKSKNFVFFSFL